MCGAHNSKFIIQNSKFLRVVPGRLELPTSTLSVWRSNQLSYRTSFKMLWNNTVSSASFDSLFEKTDSLVQEAKGVSEQTDASSHSFETTLII